MDTRTWFPGFVQLLLLTAFASPASAATIFEDGFESGSLSPRWEVSTTRTGRATVSTNYGPASGQWHLVLDDSVSDANSSSAAVTLRLDLSNKKNVILSFKAKSLGNEPDYPLFQFPGGVGNPENFDGISISTDGGTTWRFAEWLGEVATDWETFSIRLDDYIGWNARFGTDFRVQFSEYDNAAAPLDGIAIDEVRITAQDDQRAMLEVPSPLPEGTGPYTGYVLLAYAPTNAVTLELRASPFGQIQLPATIQIPAGQTLASFNFSVADDYLVNLTRSIFISAEAPDITSTPAVVTIFDDETPAVTLQLPALLIEGDSANNYSGTISLDRAPDVPMTLYLMADPCCKIDLWPSAVTVQPGQNSVTFQVRAANDYRIDGTVIVNVSVILNYDGPVLATAQTEVLDNETRELSLLLPDVILEGRTATARIQLSGTLETNLDIRLTSANPEALTVPAVVTMPAGQMQIEFSVIAADNSIRDGSRAVNISASASSFAGTNAAITIRDNEVAAYRFGGLTDIVDLGRPVPVTVAAVDVEGNVIDGFIGGVSLRLIRNDGSSQPVIPAAINLTGTNGWSGKIILPPIYDFPVRFQASDAEGNVAYSSPFDSLRMLELPAADLVWDSSRARFYASVPAEEGSTNASRVVVIDPQTGTITDGVVIGQGPGQLALTSGGEILYVALDDNGTVARINPAAMTVLSTFAVGTSQTYGTLYAGDMSTVAGQPNVLVISQRTSRYSQSYVGVAAYENGVVRPVKTPEFGSYIDQIEPSAEPGIFFARSGDNGLRRLRLDASGITEIGMKQGLFEGYNTSIRSDGNTVFSSGGVVVDGDQLRRLGQFPVSGPVLPELAINRVYFLEPAAEYYWNTYDTIGVYDPATFSNLRRLTLPEDVVSPRSFIRWGTNGVAFLTETNVILISSSRLVPTDPPADLTVAVNASPNPATVASPLSYTVCVSNQGPNAAASTLLTFTVSTAQTIQAAVATVGVPMTSSNSASMEIRELAVGACVTMVVTTIPDSAGPVTGTAGATSEATDPNPADNRAVKEIAVGFQTAIDTISRLRLKANNLVYDPTRNRLWASVPGSAGSPFAMSILSIDPNTGLLSDPIPIRGEPRADCMAISGNGRYLYVGLLDTNEIHRIDLNAPATSLRISLGLSQFGGNNFAKDIEPLDGDGTSFLMTSSADFNAAVYDGVVRRSNRTAYQSVDRIERTGTPGVFAGYASSGNLQLSSLTVTATGVAITRQAANIVNAYGGDIRGAGNLLLSSTAQLVDSSTLTLKASFGTGGRPCLDLPNQRAYILHQDTLSCFDTTTFLPAGSFSLPFSAADYWYDNLAETCVRWGLDGFAFLSSSGNIYVWRWPSTIPASADNNADAISDAWEATYFGALDIDLAGDPDADGICNFMEYLFATSPTQPSANPMRVSAATAGGQMALRLVFPRRAGLSPRPYQYMISSDLQQWTDALGVTESVLSTENVGGVQVETVEALIPTSHPVAEFVRFRWNPR